MRSAVQHHYLLLPSSSVAVAAEVNTRGLALVRRMSPVAWQHTFLNGHYTFISEGKELDLYAMIEGLTSTP